MALSTGELYVNLHAIVQNWQIINRFTSSAEVGAVVKANAYGLGEERVAPALLHAGCQTFFVANIKEAVQLRSLVGLSATIFVLAGVPGRITILQRTLHVGRHRAGGR